MGSLRLCAMAIAFCAVCATGISGAAAQEPFYKDKRLTFMINFAPGGSTDIEGRLFARHLAKHIEGQPNVVVQNVDGAGGRNGTNYLGEIAPKDGTMLGYLGGAAWGYATDPDRYRADLRTYEFIGFQGLTAVYFVRSDVPPGLKEAADILKARELVSGGLSATAGRDLSIRLTLDILGVPFRHVTGYRSGERAMLALQRSEIQLYATTTAAYRGRVEPSLVKDGTVIPLYFDPKWDGKTFGRSRQVDGLAIEPYHEFYRRVKGAMPSGEKWEAYRALVTLSGTMSRVFALPPGSPPAAVDALRAALNRLANDQQFAEEATRMIRYVPEFDAGPDTNDRVRAALTVRPELRAFVANYIKAAKK